ncbi:MAG: hypothetical protein AVDCRST_MAG19-4080, partial [uncultured Thermomicrobiales bacterium]
VRRPGRATRRARPFGRGKPGADRRPRAV